MLLSYSALTLFLNIQVSQHLKRIWTAAFRAMDDIKETVRNAGDSLCRAASSLTIRLCDVSLTPMLDASQTMDIVLPFLLGEGIMSKVANVQKASISLVMKLSKVGHLFALQIFWFSLGSTYLFPIKFLRIHCKEVRSELKGCWWRSRGECDILRI